MTTARIRILLASATFRLREWTNLCDGLPDHWRENGGVFLPMAQAEAMWISFHSTYPFARLFRAACIQLTAKSVHPGALVLDLILWTSFRR